MELERVSSTEADLGWRPWHFLTEGLVCDPKGLSRSCLRSNQSIGLRLVEQVSQRAGGEGAV